MFAFAGLWERWAGHYGMPIESCTFHTTGPNELLAPVHDRMPAILYPEDYPRWLDPTTTTPASVLPLLGPYPARLMVAHPVGLAVNSAAAEGPDLKTRVKGADRLADVVPGVDMAFYTAPGGALPGSAGQSHVPQPTIDS